MIWRSEWWEWLVADSSSHRLVSSSITLIVSVDLCERSQHNDGLTNASHSLKICHSSVSLKEYRWRCFSKYPFDDEQRIFPYPSSESMNDQIRQDDGLKNPSESKKTMSSWPVQHGTKARSDRWCVACRVFALRRTWCYRNISLVGKVIERRSLSVNFLAVVKTPSTDTSRKEMSRLIRINTRCWTHELKTHSNRKQAIDQGRILLSAMRIGKHRIEHLRWWTRESIGVGWGAKDEQRENNVVIIASLVSNDVLIVCDEWIRHLIFSGFFFSSLGWCLNQSRS